MTRTELKEQFLKNVSNIQCLGPYTIDTLAPGSPGFHAKMAAKRKVLLNDPTPENLATLAMLTDEIASLFHLNDHSEDTDIQTRSLKVLYSRYGCGYRWKDFLAEQPFDGVRRETRCPQCKVEFGWQHPQSDEDAELARLDDERRAAALLKV